MLQITTDDVTFVLGPQKAKEKLTNSYTIYLLLANMCGVSLPAGTSSRQHQSLVSFADIDLLIIVDVRHLV
jgi:hypothetical protein